MSNAQIPSFSDLLRTYRQRAGLTQEELAERAGISSRLVSDIERGVIKNSRKDTRLRLAAALQLDGHARDAFISTRACTYPDDGSALRLPFNDNDSGQSTEPIGSALSLLREQVLPLESGAHEDGRKGLGIPTTRIEPNFNGEAKDRVATVRAKAPLARRIAGLAGSAFILVILVVTLLFWSQVVRQQPGIAQNPQTSLIQDRGIVEVVGGAAGFQVYPLSRASDGQLFLEAGQSITATFKIRNTDPSGTKVVIWQAMEVSVRGPDACEQGWNAPVQDFPPVMQRVMLRPADEFTYSQSHSFDVPGVYFAEPTKLDFNGKWGGIGPFPRIYFAVTRKGDTQIPPIPCATPPPTEP